MSNDPQQQERIEILLRQGIADARNQKKAEARVNLEQVVELDPQNEKAWFWLASVVDDDQERLMCLHNVVLINPNNTRAFEILEKLEKKMKSPAAPKPVAEDGEPQDDDEAAASEEVIELAATETKAGGLASKLPFDINSLPPSQRRLVIAGGSAGLVAFILLCFLIVSGGGGGGSDPTATPDQAANQTQPTAIPSDTPEPPPTNTPRPVPPTNTPVPTATLSPTPETLPPPPPDATGRLVIGSGSPVQDALNQPIFFLTLPDAGLIAMTVDNARGHSPAIAPDASRYAYIEYNSTLRRYEPKLLNSNGTNAVPLSSLWGDGFRIEGVDLPAWAPSNTMLTFVADPASGGAGKNLYVLFFDTPEGQQPFREVTSAETISDPAWSPDAARIVFVADNGSSRDLQIHEVGANTTAPLTTDGAAIREASPDWNHANTHVVYSGQAQGFTGSDIYRIPSDGSGPPELMFDFGPNDVNPRWSPDDRFIAFSSDLTGNFEIYLYDTLTGRFYAVTNRADTADYVADWIR